MTRTRLALAAAFVAAAFLALIAFVGPGPSSFMSESAEPERSSDDRTDARTRGPSRAGVRGNESDSLVSRGVVLDGKSGAPIAGARIHVRRGSPYEDGTLVAEHLTDAGGRFEQPCAERDFVRVVASGFEPTLARLRCEDGWKIPLDAGVRIEGIVILEATKKPLAGATVACMRLHEVSPYEQTESRADGTFSLTSCGADELRLAATHPEGAPASLALGRFEPGASKSGVVIALGEGRQLRGAVVDAAGEAVPLVEIAVLEDGDMKSAQAARTDASGAFAVRISRKEHWVAAFAADGRAARITVAAGAESPEPVTLRLPSGSDLRGRVVGASLEGLQVHAVRKHDEIRPEDPEYLRNWFWGASRRGSFRRAAEIDGDRFVIHAVEPGTYHVSAMTKLAKGSGTFKHDDPNIVVTLTESPQLSLKVKWEDGTAAEGGVIVDFQSGKGFIQLHGGTGGPGFPPPEGEVTLTFVPESGVVPEPTQVELKPGANDVDWTLSRTSVRVEGRVVSLAGAPLAGALVSRADSQGGHWWSLDREHAVTTDSDGRFAIDVSSLAVRLFVLREGYVSTSVLARDAALVKLAPGASEEVVPQKPATPDRRKSGPLSLNR